MPGGEIGGKDAGARADDDAIGDSDARGDEDIRGEPDVLAERDGGGGQGLIRLLEVVARGAQE